MRPLLLCLAAVNLLALVLFGLDKRAAVRGAWRVPESVLLLVAALGGSIGAILGMRLFHHKTRKLKFSLGLPLILLAESVFVYWLATALT